MRITENSKYVVKDRATGKALTQGASRANAHSLVARLGDRFYVFNRITRRESR